MNNLKLNVPLLRKLVPNLTTAARSVGLRPATVSNLCTGKIPIGNAEVRTLVALAQLAGCSIDELLIYQDDTRMIETGIKIIDLLSPIVLGGVVGLVARLGSGQISMCAELCYRMNLSGCITILWKPNVDEMRINSIISNVRYTCSSLDEIYECLSALNNEQRVLIVADRAVVLSEELMTLHEYMENNNTLVITTVLIDVIGEAIDEDVPYGPLDALLKFDYTLSKRGIYPAIDPIYSSSTLVEDDILEKEHLSTQKQARKLLRRYRELNIIVSLKGEKTLKEMDMVAYARGKRLEAFLSQPLYTLEPVTHKKGEWLKIKETLEDVRSILDGAVDDLDPQLLSYIGRLPDGNGIST